MTSRIYHPEKKGPTAGIVLAAGMSQRMGQTKQLMEVSGKPLLAWAVEAALASELTEIVVVTGHEAEKVQEALGKTLSHPRLLPVYNGQYREGMATSLQAGLEKIRKRYPSVMFLLGDQPFLKAETINILLRRFWEAAKDICLPVHEGRHGNPVIFSRRFYELIFKIRGDEGARQIIHDHPDDVLLVEIADPLAFLDVDSATDAERVLSLGAANLLFRKGKTR